MISKPVFTMMIIMLTATAFAFGDDAPTRKVIYQNDFEDTVGSEWSAPQLAAERAAEEQRQQGINRNMRNPQEPPRRGENVAIPPISNAPNGSTKFLGEFNNHAVRLTLSDLPEHNRIRIAFNLLVIRSWDGSAGVVPGTTQRVGPDHITLQMAGDRILFRHTFCNFLTRGEGWLQSFPGILPTDQFVPGTGRVATGTYGFHGAADSTDVTYYIDITVPHDGPVVQFSLSAEGLQGITDESWGIDNVVVEVFNVEDEPELSEALFNEAWEDLAGEDGQRAWSAAWLLVAEGERVLPHIRRALLNDPQMDDHKIKAKVAALVAELESDDYYKERAARQAISELGPEAVPHLRAALQTATRQEARVFLAKQLTDATVDPFADPIKRRHARTIFALRAMQHPDAEKLIKMIEE